jgi:hypothetical protein
MAPAIVRLWKNNRLIWQRRLQRHMHLLPIICIALGGLILLSSTVWFCLEQYRINRDLESTLSRYVLPRHLTEEQIAAIATYLKGFPPQTAKILVPSGNREANSYASDFYQALQQGGWTVSIDRCIDARDRIKFSQEKLDATANDWCENLTEGLSTNFTQTMESAQAIEDPKNPKPDYLFSQSLRKAGLRLDQGGGGNGINITANSFVIKIGARKMDDGDLKARALRRERARKTLDDDEDI